MNSSLLICQRTKWKFVNLNNMDLPYFRENSETVLWQNVMIMNKSSQMWTGGQANIFHSVK